METAIGLWLAKLEKYPGWKEWQRERLKRTMWFDDPLPTLTQERLGDFKFSSEIEKEHAVSE